MSFRILLYLGEGVRELRHGSRRELRQFRLPARASSPMPGPREVEIRRGIQQGMHALVWVCILFR